MTSSATSSAAAANRATAPRVLRRLAGALLIGLGTLPLFRMLDYAETGYAGRATAWFMSIHLEFVWFGLLLLVPIAIACAAFVPRRVDEALARLARHTLAVPVGAWAAACAAVTLGLGSAFSLHVLEGQPNLIDSFAQLMHARYWAEGRLAGPVSDLGGFFSIQNSLFTERGWVSQYPPGHVAWLALFLYLGIPWAAGPVMMAVTVFFATLVIARLLPDRPLTVRLGGILLAASPLFVVIGASYMNHVTTAALVCAAAWTLLRAWQERAAWALFAGAAFGWSLATRPLSTVAMAAALTLLVPFTVSRQLDMRRFVRILILMAAGSLPFIGLLLAYNNHFFGTPFASGYEIAMGPQMRLGFLRDPWGNLYGVREAIAYTNADLMALGVNLFESPLSAVIVIGAFLIVAPRLSAGERVLVGWAAAPVVTNFFYWHHGNFMGPRMLFEALPAWVMLFAAAASFLGSRIDSSRYIGRYRPRAAVAGVLILATAFGLLVMAPQRALSYGGSWHDVTRTPVPPLDRPSLIFVHDAWSGRVNMTLASNGYRLDLIETLVRQNSTCRLQELAAAAASGDVMREHGLLSSLDTVPRATGTMPRLVEIAPGDNIRVFEGESLTPECMRQVRADARGILDLAPLIWRGDLPGGPARGPLFARDMGPERNAELIAQHPGREPWVYMLPAADVEDPVLVPYAEAMRLLWEAQ